MKTEYARQLKGLKRGLMPELERMNAKSSIVLDSEVVEQ